MPIRTAFVTGASGFIGTHLVGHLLDRGCEVRCLVRPTTRAEQLARPGVVRIDGMLAEPDSYRRGLFGCDAVFHLAGILSAARPAAMLRTNGGGTRRLADACATIPSPPRFVHVSSLAAAGPPPPDRAFRDENDPPAPISVYGRSKRDGERVLERRARDLPVTIVRPGIVYGAGDAQGAQIFRAIRRTGLHVVVGFHTPRLSLVHADDLAELLVAAAARGETLAGTDGTPAGFGAPERAWNPRGYYLACDDREHPTYGEFGRRVAAALGCGVVVWPLWRWVGRAVGAAAEAASRHRGRASVLTRDKIREATAPNWACSAAKARSQLGFRPALPLDMRLRETAEWFGEHGWL
jgi:dihydroflavonol-4-reductase